MQAFFVPGLLLISIFGPWGRAGLAIALYAACVAAAMTGHTTLAWSLFPLPCYILGAMLMWGQLGIVRISKMMERIASGDLSTRSDLSNSGGKDAVRMWRSIDSMSESIASIVGQVNASCDVINQAARELSHGYANLSERTEQQASTLEETASATEELTATVRQNAEGCQRASTLAQDARAIASHAAESMRRLTETMSRIQDGSKRVAEITALIESIAFQTNILALNAAVEAANAGEHGRGFAVVASEVRSLAQRCSHAAREIRGVIGESAGAVDDGGKLVAEAATTIDRAAGSVGAVSEVISDIARASAEQSSGVEGIGKAIQQLDGMTQQNAALVEQTGSAARAFEEQAARLLDVAGLFKLDLNEEREIAVTLVQRGIRRVEAKGPEAAFREFEDRKGRFVRGDHYLWVCDLQGVVRCHAMRPKSRGENHAELRDAQGKAFVHEILRIARERGRGWVDYQWINPATKVVEPKSTYFERCGALVVMCGIYRHDGATPLPTARLPRPLALAR
jgi:methyl-accepting chemotaxis protein